MSYKAHLYRFSSKRAEWVGNYGQLWTGVSVMCNKTPMKFQSFKINDVSCGREVQGTRAVIKRAIIWGRNKSTWAARLATESTAIECQGLVVAGSWSKAVQAQPTAVPMREGVLDTVVAASHAKLIENESNAFTTVSNALKGHALHIKHRFSAADWITRNWNSSVQMRRTCLYEPHVH